MKTIYKFPLVTQEENIVRMPLGAQILTVQSQFEEPMLWALVDTDKPLVQYKFRIYGTGHEVSDDEQKYIGTYQTHAGNYVFHLFEIV